MATARRGRSPTSAAASWRSYDYDVYGVALNFNPNTAKTNWQFGGDGLWDPNSLFTYHLARFRDGARFVSYDSFEADPATPAALHKYLYAGANPVQAWDASGNETMIAMLMSAGISSLLDSMLWVTPAQAYKEARTFELESGLDFAATLAVNSRMGEIFGPSIDGFFKTAALEIEYWGGFLQGAGEGAAGSTQRNQRGDGCVRRVGQSRDRERPGHACCQSSSALT